MFELDQLRLSCTSKEEIYIVNQTFEYTNIDQFVYQSIARTKGNLLHTYLQEYETF
jgi:hypothetical protein